MRPGLRPFIRVAAEPIARMGGGAAALCRRPWASSLRSTGENYLHRNALPLRPKRSLVIGVENEAAARIDRIGAEDALVVLACKRARLAAFSFDETNNCSAYACRPNRAERSWSCGPAVPIALSPFGTPAAYKQRVPTARER
jgi:hypothetical protein